jgi:cyclase
MKYRYLAAIVPFLAFFAEPAAAASAPSGGPPEPAVVTTPLRGGVYLLMGRGGNITLLASDDGALLVDDQYKERTAMIRAAVAEITPQPIRWVINTHWHIDHTGGNENLGAMGVTIIAQDNARRHMAT